MRRLECVPFGPEWLDFVYALAMKRHAAFRAAAPGLPVAPPCTREGFEALFRTGTGRVALEDGQPVGYLVFGPAEDWGGSLACASPLWGYGVANGQAEKVLGHLWQTVAEDARRKGITHLSMSVSPLDGDALRLWQWSGFVMDLAEEVCVSAAPGEAPTLLPGEAPALLPGYRIQELNKAEIAARMDALLALYGRLIRHLQESPVFYPCEEFFPLANRGEDFLQPGVRVFGLFHGEELVGMLNADAPDVAMAQGDPLAASMTDIFLLPAHRLPGLSRALFAFVRQALAESGAARIYVRHGTANPTARHFWGAHFVAYAYTLALHINPKMLTLL